ncbi:MAG: sigma-54-dependent Fis family transcriptional regulator [Rhodanobacteraceae bacterium]|nr:sigma-54-dependent Fis family transcriptional regulator [Rhodanobacteraceae bacterium]
MADASLLVVEDDAAQRELIQSILRSAGYTVRGTDSTESALRLLAAQTAQLVVSDWKLKDSDGMALLRSVRSDHPGVGFVLATAYGSIQHAIEAMRAGADDYLPKPFERQALLLTVEKALRARALSAENQRLSERLGEREKLVDLVGKAPSMQLLYRRIEKIAGTEASVLISGESGTGKELVARALHRLSRRAAGEFVAVNCAAIPEGLMEAEFFGAEKGAYTGAHAARAGRFEAASGGTLFLDEIGELPLTIQPKLLRALQEGVITRVGSQREVRTDVRLVAATNRSLEAEVAAGRFREDLFYRLNVVPIALPPLRERREDIPALVEHFAARAARLHRLDPIPAIPRSVLKRLIDAPWKGNVRELGNVVERLLLLADANGISVDDLPPEPTAEPAGGIRLPAEGLSLAALEASLLRQALERESGNRSRAAKLLDLPYKAFLYRLEKHGLASADDVS